MNDKKNRGYCKIAGAARAFNFDFQGKTVLDIGSSTGGFTQYALDHGAKKVIAVEKGTNQMKNPTKSDPRVDLHEKTDIFNVKLGENPSNKTDIFDIKLRERPPDKTDIFDLKPTKQPSNKTLRPGAILADSPDIILADVSFTPLTKILMYAKMELARSNTDFLVMLKPQFETTNIGDLNRGVVKNASIRRRIIKDFEHWLKINNFVIVSKRDNELSGRHGNVERFYWLKLAK